MDEQKNPVEAKQYYTVREIAKLFRVTQRTIYQWIDQRALNPLRMQGVLRFDTRDIASLIESKKMETLPPLQERKKILLVEDDKPLLESMTKLFTKEGYNLVPAENAQIAIEKCEAITFDLILADIRLPGMNGVSMAKEIKKISAKKKKSPTPLLLISAYADDETLLEAKKIGAADFFFKPFDPVVLLGSVKRALNKAEEKEESVNKRP